MAVSAAKSHWVLANDGAVWEIVRTAAALAAALRAAGKVLLLGNGGNTADVKDLAAELVGGQPGSSFGPGTKR
jgi:phosphoheptose isomerase